MNQAIYSADLTAGIAALQSLGAKSLGVSSKDIASGESFAEILSSGFSAGAAVDCTQADDTADALEAAGSQESDKVFPEELSEAASETFANILAGYLISLETNGSSPDMKALLSGIAGTKLNEATAAELEQLAELIGGIDLTDQNTSQNLFASLALSEPNSDKISVKDVLDSLIKLPTVKTDTDDTTASYAIAALSGMAFSAPAFMQLSFASEPNSGTTLAGDVDSVQAGALSEAQALALNLIANSDENTLEDFCKAFAQTIVQKTDATDAQLADAEQTDGLQQPGSMLQSDDAAPELTADTASAHAVKARINTVYMSDSDESSGADAETGVLANSEKSEFSELFAAASAAVTPNVLTQTENTISSDADSLYDSVEKQIVDKLCDMDLKVMYSGETKTLTMRLDPEELGSLEITLKSTENGVSVAFITQSAETAEIIGKKAAALSEALAARGVKLSELDVSVKIVTNESSSSGLDLSGQSFAGYGGKQPDNADSYGYDARKSMHFTASESGALTETSSLTDVTEKYDHKEGMLWVSA